MALPFFWFREPAEHDELSLALRDDAGDRALLERLRRGETSALTVIMEQYAGRLVRAARTTVRDSAIAEDVVQDVFVRLWERRERLDIRGALLPYLLRAVRYEALDAARHERSQQRVAHEMTQDHASHVENTGLNAIDAADTWRTIRAGLDEVAPQCREIFLLNWEQGLSYAEIAAYLGVTRRTVYNQMYRAMQRISARLTG